MFWEIPSYYNSNWCHCHIFYKDRCSVINNNCVTKWLRYWFIWEMEESREWIISLLRLNPKDKCLCLAMLNWQAGVEQHLSENNGCLLARFYRKAGHTSLQSSNVAGALLTASSPIPVSPIHNCPLLLFITPTMKAKLVTYKTVVYLWFDFFPQKPEG